MEASNKRAKSILDAKYEKTNVQKYVADNCEDINALQKELLLQLLLKHEQLLDGTLGKWNRRPVSLRVKPNVKISSSVPFSVPHFTWKH